MISLMMFWIRLAFVLVVLVILLNWSSPWAWLFFLVCGSFENLTEYVERFSHPQKSMVRIRGMSWRRVRVSCSWGVRFGSSPGVYPMCWRYLLIVFVSSWSSGV